MPGINNIKQNKTNEKLSKTTNSKIDSSKNILPNGHQFITNFSFNTKIKSICQDSSGIMLFLTSKGIIFFDGITEKELPIKNNPNLLLKDKKRDIFYVSTSKGFGVVKRNKSGNYEFNETSINNNEKYTNIFENENKVFFRSKHKIFCTDKNEPLRIELEYFDESKIITGAFNFNNKLYASFSDLGLHIIEKESTSSLLSDSIFLNYKISFAINNGKSVLIGMSNNNIYSFNGKTYKKFITSSDEYIKESVITGALDYNENEFIVTTLNGGAIIINKKNGKTSHTINYRTGLPDDEIYASSTNINGELWLSHDYGVSRIAFDVPVSNYNYYPGLQGKINYVKVIDSSLYIATGEGLFVLSEIKNYNEVEVATKTKKKTWKRISPKKKKNKNIRNNSYSETINSISDEDIEQENEKKGFFKRWKERKEKKKQEKIIAEDVEKNNKSKEDATPKSNIKKKTRYKAVYKEITEYKKIYELQSVRNIYKKIKGINSKCKHLKEFNGYLLASTNSGLFYVKDTVALPLIPNTYINDISGDNKSTFSATEDGIYKITKKNNKLLVSKIKGETINKASFHKIFKVNDSTLWGSSQNSLFRLSIKGSNILSSQKFKLNIDQSNKLKIIESNDTIIFITSNFAYYYDRETLAVREYSKFDNILKNKNKIFSLSDTSIIITENNFIKAKFNTSKNLNHLKYAWLFENIEKILSDDNNNFWVICQNNSLFKISKNSKKNKREFKLFITDVTDKNGKSFANFNEIKLQSNYEFINIQLTSPYYLKKGFVKYYFTIDSKNTENYIESSGPEIKISVLPAGNHTIYFTAINDLNEQSELIKIKLTIEPPFWKSTTLIVISFLVLLILTAILISAFYRRKQRRIKEYNEILEIKVKERTAEIEQQNQLIKNQNNEIYEQYEKINYQNNEIKGSIRYAGKIQKAALPDTSLHKKYLSGFFNLYKPRDIVSGDFYWMAEAKNKLLVAAVDCTGHGVPGGFLSMLGISFLNEIINDLIRKEGDIDAAGILNSLRSQVISTLHQHTENTTHDGMDMALAIIDKKNMSLNFAGANNPAYIIRNEKLSKIEADRIPIGYNKKLNNSKFTNKYVKLMKDDLIYIFSDGYADQFGGKFGKKFNLRRFRELLMHIQKHPLEKQKEISETVLLKWKNDNIQVDDILLIGMKI